MILNLAGITKIDSSGLGELVAAHAGSDGNRDAVKLLCVPEDITDLTMMTKLLTVFDIYDDEQSAVESFEDHRQRITKEILITSDGRLTQEFPENFEADLMAD